MAIDKDHAARTALRLLDAEGLEKLTVRRLARELGVQAPALYWHFANKRALLDHMTDAMLAPAAARLGHPRPGQPWWEWLEETLTGLRRALLAHRDGAAVASAADLRRALALGLHAERITEVLYESGFALADASRAAGAAIHFLVGRVVEEQSRGDAETERAMIADADFPFPFMARSLHARHAAAATPDDDFGYALAIVVTGLRTLHADAAATATARPPESRP
ncbi:TetR family transcriptional regulator [Streptomyces sp. NBC_00005]|uniref:TetR family transcriptional regulator n=1 Tax=Streptomyces sp. NBC_00005 TaxID=2903609 RepID=UPI00386FEC24